MTVSKKIMCIRIKYDNMMNIKSNLNLKYCVYSYVYIHQLLVVVKAVGGGKKKK